MNYPVKCLYCHGEEKSFDYNCSCKSKMWASRYRTLDIEVSASRHKTEAIRSFLNYDFNNEEGILQYKLLPYTRQRSDKTIGLTPLHYLPNFSTGNQHILLKDEGQNPSGCFKDRESLMCLLHSKAENLTRAVIYSSGNAAASAALMFDDSPGRLITFVPGDTYPEKIKYIQNHGSDVIVIGDKNTTFETGYRLFADMNAARIFADNGFDNWSVTNPFRVQGDKTIAVEIVKQLSLEPGKTIAPDFVVVPTANGSCLAGIWKGFKELYETNIIDKLPKMISAGIKNASPVCKAVQQHQTDKPVRCDLSKTAEEDASVGSIILAEEGYDSIQAAKAVIESNGFAVELHASDIRKSFIKFLSEENDLALQHSVLPEPASMTSLAALKKAEDELLQPKENIIVSIGTGHGLKARQKIDTLLEGNPGLKKTAEKIISEGKARIPPHEKGAGIKVSTDESIASVFEAFLALKKSYSHGKIQPI